MEPEREREGPPESVRVAAAALRSRRHAEMLFDAVVAALGDRAWQETENGGTIRRLYRRDPVDPTLIVPWPVLELNTAGRFGVVSDWMPFGDAPFAPAPPPAPPAPPKLRGLGPGEIRLVDGDEYIELVYDDSGVKVETCRSHHAHPLAGLAPAVAARSANPTELLVQFLAALDPGRHGPGRVWMPVALPSGAAGVWLCGRGALRRALFADGVPRDVAWAVADGLTGNARGFAATRDEALARWRAAVAASMLWPIPGPAPELPTDIPADAKVVHGPSPDASMPDAVPENVPAAIVPLAPAPAEPPTFGSWTTLLGARGATSFAARRNRRDGFTLIGEHLLAVVDTGRLDAELDRIDAEHEERLRAMLARTAGSRARRPFRTGVYRVSDGDRLEFDQSGEGESWHAGELDGDVIARRVVRHRRVR